MRIVRLCIAMLFCFGVAIGVLAEPRTVLKKKGQEPELVDSASYSRRSKEYRITKGVATFSVPEAQVEYCRPPKPKGFDTMHGVPQLEEVVEKYHRLWWDVEAFKRLMLLYLDKGENKKAIRLFRDMKSVIRQPMPLRLHQAYWQALKNDKQFGTLAKVLTETITTRSREESAWAYLMRGDILVSQGNQKDALVDGYLKVVILFQDIKSCRKKALEKTIDTMENLGDTRAEKFKRQLREEFPK